jgi:hypothetical protein
MPDPIEPADIAGVARDPRACAGPRGSGPEGTSRRDTSCYSAHEPRTSPRCTVSGAA